MRLFWDIKTGVVSSRLGGCRSCHAALLVRSVASWVEVYPVNGFVLPELTDPNMAFVLKVVNKFDSAGVALVQPLELDEELGCYTGRINLITTPLNALLGVDGSDSNDVPSVTLMGGFGYMEGTEWVASEAFDVLLKNNPSRGTETPADGPGESGTKVYSALTGGGDAIDGITTVGITPPQVAFAVVGGVFSVWQLQAGTAAENPGGGVIRPDDYATTTNEKVWIQAA